MNDNVNQPTLTHLSIAETRLAAILARPKPVAIGCIVVLAALGWGAFGLMLARPEGAWLDAVCGPSLARTWAAIDAALILTMWAAMTLAMMLPSAAPMILTYAEIADTAAQKHEPIVSPLVLTMGYVAIWLGFAVAAAGTQTSLTSAGLIDAVKAPLAGAIFLIAGLYQFSRLKAACLALCQRPFPFFFANWTTETRGVFVLGLRQGAYCLGCCWALMLIMFAVGTMNALWMATLGALMTIEKMTSGARFSRALGIVLIAIGIALVALEFR